VGGGGPPVYPTTFVEFLHPSQPTVDAVGPGKCAYQMTLADSHSVSSAGLEAAVRHLGATMQEPLRLCIVVPTTRLSAWERRVVALPDSVPCALVRVYVIGIDATSRLD
jgi:hypothetical protein